MKAISLKILFISTIFCLSAQENLTPPLITFFIHPASDLKKAVDIERLNHKAEKLGSLNRSILKAKLAPAITHGIYALYAGMVSRSDSNGQVIFPRKTTQGSLTLIVAPRIQPVFLTSTIIHHFIISDKATAQQYLLTRHGDNPAYWNVVKQTLVPSSRIPNSALIIFAKADDIIIPEIDTVTKGGSNLILPSIYVKPTINTSLNALNFIKISKYFAPVKLSYRFTPDRYGTVANP